jgi:toxin ParE1/3/4
MFPEMGREVPEANQSDIREIICRPYRIIYKLEYYSVKIITVVHSRRDLSKPELRKWRNMK